MERQRASSLPYMGLVDRRPVVCRNLAMGFWVPLQFVLRTDASDYAVGAVLEQVLDDQRHVPVAFWSRVLAEGQRRTWTPREKEAYAIVMALRKWAGYIALHPVTVCTNHQSLQSWHKEHVDTPSGPASRRARWHETLAKFDLTVVYDPGKDNTCNRCIVVDLCCNCEACSLDAPGVVTPDTAPDISEPT